MKRSLVIVGAGLGGCFLASCLADSWDITFIELGVQGDELQKRMRDVDVAAVTYPHLGVGLGGTTSLWHNGLIEIEEEVFKKKWPFEKSELTPYYERAYKKLSGVDKSTIETAAADLREKLIALGVPKGLLALELYYPRQRINAWHSLGLSGRVKVIEGEVTGLVPGRDGLISHVRIKSKDSEKDIYGDHFVLAAGGLGTPLLLQSLGEQCPSPSLQHAGSHYEDHPSAFVAEVELDVPLYKLWNYPVAGIGGSLRLPLVVKQDGLLIAFQLRPASHLKVGEPRNRLVSILYRLRNEPFNISLYFSLLTHWDDIFEILSFKFGIRFPTRRYALLMVAEQASDSMRAVWRDQDGVGINRKWTFTQAYWDTLRSSVEQLLNKLSMRIKRTSIFPNWPHLIFSSSHHSGTARISKSPDEGACDADGRVFGFKNLYVSDGSLIPASGYANTGLTIAALAMRVADRLQENARKL